MKRLTCINSKRLKNKMKIKNGFTSIFKKVNIKIADIEQRDFTKKTCDRYSTFPKADNIQ